MGVSPASAYIATTTGASVNTHIGCYADSHQITRAVTIRSESALGYTSQWIRFRTRTYDYNAARWYDGSWETAQTINGSYTRWMYTVNLLGVPQGRYHFETQVQWWRGSYWTNILTNNAAPYQQIFPGMLPYLSQTCYA